MVVVLRPVSRRISERVYPHLFQSACPWIRKFSPELAEDSPFKARALITGKDAVALNSLGDRKRLDTAPTKMPSSGVSGGRSVVPAPLPE